MLDKACLVSGYFVNKRGWFTMKNHLKQKSISRRLPAYAIFPLHIYSQYRVNKPFFISHHWHDEIEIIFIEKGDFIIHVNGIAHHMRKGEVLFINSQEIHQIKATTESSIHHAIVFKPEILLFEWHEPSAREFINPLVQKKVKLPSNINSHSLTKKSIEHEIVNILTAYHNEKKTWRITAKASLLRIIVDLIEHGLLNYPISEEEIADEKSLIAKEIMTFIHENYMFKITLDMLAELVGFNTHYFCKFFKSMFGKTAIEYINEYRIEKACQLLLQTDDKITEIAFAVGFDSSSYFIRKFKALKTMTPSAYRNENLAKKNVKI